MYAVSNDPFVVVLYEPVQNWSEPAPLIYSRAPLTLDLVLAADPRRWMAGRYPPPVEVELASLALPVIDPPCELPRRPSRMLARLRERRPLRGRSGRPHAT